MKRVVLWLVLSLAVSASAEVKHIKFTLSGGDAGDNSYETFAGGKFISTTKLKLGPQSLESTLTGVEKGGELVEWTLEESSGATKGKIVWKDNKALVEQSGKVVLKDHDAPWRGKGFFSPYHPLLAHLNLAVYEKATDKKKIQILNPNALTTIPLEPTLRQTTVEVGGKPMPVTLFTLKVTGIDIDFAFTRDKVPVGIRVAAQSFQGVVDGFEGVFVDPLAKYPELSQPTIRKVKHETLSAKMRDGVPLVSEVVRPDAEGKFPTILIRTPYGREASALEGEFYAKRGYVLVAQDVRGKGKSGGKFDPLNSEVADGKDTLDWITQQSWSDGKVGMIGGSYLAYVQWAAAVTHHPALKCIVPQVSPSDPMHNFPWDHGVFMLAPSLWWARIVKDQDADLTQAGRRLQGLIPALKALPITKVDDKAFGTDLPWFDEWVKRDTIEKWPGAFREDQVSQVKIPVLHVSGFWDGDGVGTKIHWESLRANGGNQWLIFGPWEHGFNVKTQFAGEEYGANSILELNSVYLRFFDTYLKDRAVGWDKQPRVRFFVTGANFWLNVPDWPAPMLNKQVLYLGGGNALGKDSKGTLVAKPEPKGEDRFAYDPTKPRVDPKQFEVESQNASMVVKAKDIPANWMLYRSPAFTEDTLVAGPVKVDLFAKTTARDANFHALVLEEAPNGDLRVIELPGTMRATFPSGKLLTPGKPFQVTVEPWLFARQFKKGTRLAVAITTDMFPQFARNPGTGEPLAKATRLRKATHTILKSATWPSRIVFWSVGL